MSFKAVVFCASAFFIQSISGQCARPIIAMPSCNAITVSDNGGPLIISSVGPIRPSGIAVATNLDLAGNLDLNGALPFLSAVAFEGQFPNSGSAAVSYGCGDGCVAITQEQGNPSGNNAAASSGISASQLSCCGRR